jgi:hypothetical protein
LFATSKYWVTSLDPSSRREKKNLLGPPSREEGNITPTLKLGSTKKKSRLLPAFKNFKILF